MTDRTQELEPDWYDFELLGPHWQARVHLPTRFSRTSNFLEVRRQGQLISTSSRPFFEHFPCCLQIFLDGDLEADLDPQTLRPALVRALEERLDPLLGVLVKRVFEGIPGHPDHYCSLLCLRMRPQPDERRGLPHPADGFPILGLTDYPVFLATDQGPMMFPLHHLLYTSTYDALVQSRVIKTLASWLREENWEEPH